jgi:hypothetical protein
MLHKSIFLLPIVLLAGCAQVFAAERECLGNIETFDKKIVQVNVRYKMWFEISDKTALVRVAGREFKVEARRGNSWKGDWLQLIGEDQYFSFLPEEGGTLKL